MGWFKKKKRDSEVVLDRSTLVPRIKTLQFTAAFRRGHSRGSVTIHTNRSSLISWSRMPSTCLPCSDGQRQGNRGAGIPEGNCWKSHIANLCASVLKSLLPARTGLANRNGPESRSVYAACRHFWDDMAARLRVKSSLLFRAERTDVLQQSLARGITLRRAMADGILERETTHALTRHCLSWRGLLA